MLQVDGLDLVSPGGLTPAAIALEAGWNLVAWLGQTTDVATALAPIAGAVDTLFTWAPDAGFLRFSPAGPGFLNQVEFLAPGQGVWVLATQAATWNQQGSPAALLDRTVVLGAGFNLVAWTGAEGLSPAEVFDPASAVINAVIDYDAAAPGFRQHFPGAAPFLNTLGGLRFGHALWIDASAPAALDIAAP